MVELAIVGTASIQTSMPELRTQRFMASFGSSLVEIIEKEVMSILIDVSIFRDLHKGSVASTGRVE